MTTLKQPNSSEYNIYICIASIAPLAMHQPNQKPTNINQIAVSSQLRSAQKKKKQNEKYRYKRRLYPSSPPVADDRLPSNLN